MTLTRPTSLTDPRFLRALAVAGSILLAMGLAGSLWLYSAGVVLTSASTMTCAVLSVRRYEWQRWKQGRDLDERERDVLLKATELSQLWTRSVASLAGVSLAVSQLLGDDTLRKSIVLFTVIATASVLEWMPPLNAMVAEQKALADE